MKRARPAEGGLQLRHGSQPATRHDVYLGAKQVKEGAEACLQIIKRQEYQVRDRAGRMVAVDIEWLPVRFTFRPKPDGLSTHAITSRDQVLALRLPLRCQGEVIIPALASMHLRWPSRATARRAS